MKVLVLAVATGVLAHAGSAHAVPGAPPASDVAPEGGGSAEQDVPAAPGEPTRWDDPSDAVGFGTASAPTAQLAPAAGGDASDALGFGGAAPQLAPVDTGPVEQEQTASSSSSLRGFARGRTAVWAERLSQRPLAKALQSIDLELRHRRDWGPGRQFRLQLAAHAEYDLAYSDPPPLDEEGRPVGTGLDDRATVEAYRSLVYPREAFAAAVLSPVEVIAGYQIIPWGQGEMLSVVDVVNPRDLREPGLDELEDVRVPVLAGRVRGNFGEHTIEYIAVPERSWGFLPPPLAPFSPARAVLAEQVPEGMTARWTHTPGRFGEAVQLFGRWTYKGSGLDLEFHAARLYDRTGVLLPPDTEAVRDGGIDLELEHLPYVMVGHSGASPLGEWLLRWELAAEFDRPIALAPQEDGVVAMQANVLSGLFGLNYAGFSRTTLSLDATYTRFVNQFESLVPVQYPTVAVRGTYTSANERLSLNGVLVVFGLEPSYGWLARADLSYSVLDSLSVTLGYVTYQPRAELGPIAGFDTHDRVYASWRYDFQMLD